MHNDMRYHRHELLTYFRIKLASSKKSTYAILYALINMSHLNLLSMAAVTGFSFFFLQYV